MEITDLTIRILLLVFPGLIAYFIVHEFTEQKRENFIIETIKILIYSFLSYSIYATGKIILALFIKTINKDVYFLKCLIDKTADISWIEILVTAFIALFISCIITKLINKSWFHKTAQELKLTKKFGDLDVWSYLFNGKQDFYMIIRDIENNLTYQGYPQAFAKDHNEAEVLLINVMVYRYEDSTFLYKIDSMYYKFNSEKFSFEIQFIEEVKDEK